MDFAHLRAAMERECDKPPRYSLRTLLLVAAAGPPLVALVWWWSSWALAGFRWSLWDLALLLLFPGTGLVVILAAVSVFYYPGEMARRVSTSRRPAFFLWAFQFLVLWHWFTFISVLGGWLLIWGDRHEPPLHVIVPLAA